MEYDGFLGYVVDEEMPRTLKDDIDKFLNLPKNEQTIYFSMVEKGLDYAEKCDEFGHLNTYKMEDWTKRAVEYILKINPDQATKYAIDKSTANINSYKCPGKSEEESLNNIDESDDNSIITWDEFFMGVAKLAAKRSKDPSTKVGAVIVRDNHIISTGYNGMPFTMEMNNDSVYPWERGTCKEDSKYSFVVHAEMNAILSSPVPVAGGTLYCTLSPCNECAKAIVQSKIAKVIYLKSRDEDIFNIGKNIIKNAGIMIVSYNDKRR